MPHGIERSIGSERRDGRPSRRAVLSGIGAALAAPAALSGCTASSGISSGDALDGTLVPVDYAAPILTEAHVVPGVPRLPPALRRRIVPDPTGEAPGTIVVDAARYALFLVRADGTALRYRIGLGRAGFGWTGRAVVGSKRRWPRWRPPAEMIAREPRLAVFGPTDGRAPGPDNPLGARALDLHRDGRDTLYRIHGSLDAQSIGRAVSAGCVRMLNHDVIDLYDRVPVGTPVNVR